MQHLDHRRVFQQRRKRLPVIDCQRVNQVGSRPIANLNQTGNRIKGVDPHKLGVESYERQMLPFKAMLAEAIVVANPVNIDGHTALP